MRVWEVDVSSRVMCVFIWERQRYVSVWVPDERFVGTMEEKKERRRKKTCKEKKDRVTQMMEEEESGGVIKKRERERGVSWLGPSFVLKEGRGGGGEVEGWGVCGGGGGRLAVLVLDHSQATHCVSRCPGKVPSSEGFRINSFVQLPGLANQLRAWTPLSSGGRQRDVGDRGRGTGITSLTGVQEYASAVSGGYKRSLHPTQEGVCVCVCVYPV